eukprot:m.24066 g.24066  ORF g.24066 m.24066 type:complete len:135 (+) comp4126_c0_seq1:224-628(+)
MHPVLLQVRRQREVTGIALYVLSIVAAVGYGAWAIAPIHVGRLSHDTAPDSYWAVAVPMWLCVTLLSVLTVYSGMVLYSIAAADDIASVTDSHSPKLEADPLDAERIVPRLQDIPLVKVNHLMFGSSTIDTHNP